MESIGGSIGRSTGRPRLAFARIWNMCFGLFGVQIVWGLQNANTSRIFQTLGASVESLPFLWIAAPITGLLVQPVIGYLSDRTWGPLGRRRPYILGGAVLTAISLVIMPNAHSLLAAISALWLLTASINITAEPFRAFVADTLPEEQRTTGFALQVFFIGVGAVFASAMSWMLTHWFGLSGTAAPGMLPQSVRLAFYIGAIVLIVAVAWTVFTTTERPTDCLDADAPDLKDHAIPDAGGTAALARSGGLWMLGAIMLGALSRLERYPREMYVVAAIGLVFGALQLTAVRMRRAGRISLGMIEIVEDILHMPLVMKRLALVQFFTWFGMFALWVYAIPAVAARHYGTVDALSDAYGDSADWVGILFAAYNGVAALVALALPRMAIRIGRRISHALCLAAGALGMTGFMLIDDAGMLWLPAIGIGIAWASILSLPYAMLADAVPPRKMGVYMGIHNIFLVLPQLFAAAVLGYFVKHVFHGEAIAALGLAAGTLAIGAVFALAVPDLARRT